jgi:transcriptional regulator with XRE-family HTH domain
VNEHQREILRRLRQARAAQGMTCKELARRAGLARQTVSRLLRAQTWHWGTVAAVAVVLRVDVTLTAPRRAM